MKNIGPFPLTYQRENRHVFSASKGQGTMPSTSAKKLDKGKQKIKEEEEKDQHEVEKESKLIHIDSYEENEARISSLLLQNKNAQI